MSFQEQLCTFELQICRCLHVCVISFQIHVCQWEPWMNS